MKKTKELIAFETLTNDPNENADNIYVVFLDSKLLKMADKFKNEKSKQSIEMDFCFDLAPNEKR